MALKLSCSLWNTRVTHELFIIVAFLPLLSLLAALNAWFNNVLDIVFDAFQLRQCMSLAQDSQLLELLIVF